MAQLTGTPQKVILGPGYAIRSPGIQGTAELKSPLPPGTRAGRAPEDGTSALDEALVATNVTEVRRVELTLKPIQAAGATRALRSGDGTEELELEVPDPGVNDAVVVLESDEAGVMRWHFPLAEEEPVQVATRGAGDVKRFRIPATQPSSPSAAATVQRGIVGAIGRKILKVLVYPLLDPVIGAISKHFAENWETRNRPYGVRTFSPADRKTPGTGAVTSADWERLAKGRALLFIHGTFSTAHAGFEQIPDEVFASLHERYEGRVFAFNHFTLSRNPRENIDWLLAQVPAGRELEVDIVCHSRGGLVARALSERAGTSPIKVRRIVFAAVPNQGTLLAQPDHMSTMLDRLTTALNLFPSGFVTETLEALITGVKVVSHGALGGLPGLAAMDPKGAYLKDFNMGTPKGDGYYGIAVDFEPADTDQGLRKLITGKVADAVLDRVFQDAANDLVVPEAGVYSMNGSGAFPIPEARLLRVPKDRGIIHTTVFSHPPVGERMLEWLV